MRRHLALLTLTAATLTGCSTADDADKAPQESPACAAKDAPGGPHGQGTKVTIKDCQATLGNLNAVIPGGFTLRGQRASENQATFGTQGSEPGKKGDLEIDLHSASGQSTSSSMARVFLVLAPEKFADVGERPQGGKAIKVPGADGAWEYQIAFNRDGMTPSEGVVFVTYDEDSGVINQVVVSAKRGDLDQVVVDQVRKGLRLKGKPIEYDTTP